MSRNTAVISAAPERVPVALANHPSRQTVTQPSSARVFAAWRRTGLGLLRILFGLVWAVDAYFKWQPDFHANLETYLAEGAEGQPAAVQAWVTFWLNIVGVEPHFFGIIIALGETALAIALLLGVLSNLAYLGGGVLSLVIWSTAEGFGGPYVAGSTDIGSAIIYVLVFVALSLTSAGLSLGLDAYLTPRLGRWGVLASGPLEQSEEARPGG